LGADPPCPIGSSALDVRASPFMSKTPCQRVSTATDCRPCPNLDQTFAAIDAHEDQMVKVLTAEGRGDGLPVGPVYFSKDYVRRGFLCKDKRYPQGRRGVILHVHKFLGRVTHVDLRLPDGEFLLEVPIDYVRTLD
jgi:hypothetical protein